MHMRLQPKGIHLNWRGFLRKVVCFCRIWFHHLYVCKYFILWVCFLGRFLHQDLNNSCSLVGASLCSVLSHFSSYFFETNALNSRIKNRGKSGSSSWWWRSLTWTNWIRITKEPPPSFSVLALWLELSDSIIIHIDNSGRSCWIVKLSTILWIYIEP